MKYMSFNSSCAYTGLANMLEALGHDATDRDIALGMELPYLFGKEAGIYCAGPMLQSKQWFDLYLLPRGFCFEEMSVPRCELPALLTTCIPAMIGLRITPEIKHAVVCTSAAHDCYHFINNRHPQSPEPDTLEMAGDELLLRVDETVHVASLHRCEPQPVAMADALVASLKTLHEYRQEMRARCDQALTASALRSMMNTHFRAILVDALTMMHLTGHASLVQQLTDLQSSLLTAVKAGREGRLSALLPMDDYDHVLAQLEALIVERSRSF